MTDQKIKQMIRQANEHHRKADQKEFIRHMVFWAFFLGFWIGLITFFVNFVL